MWTVLQIREKRGRPGTRAVKLAPVTTVRLDTFLSRPFIFFHRNFSQVSSLLGDLLFKYSEISLRHVCTLSRCSRLQAVLKLLPVLVLKSNTKNINQCFNFSYFYKTVSIVICRASIVCCVFTL